MHARPLPLITTDIVLLGAGHAHVQVMRAFGMNPVPGIRVTVVTDRLLSPYSGMLPGCVAGDHPIEDIHIDVARLARETGVRLIHACASGLDRASRRVILLDRPPLAYDLLSINVGITPDLSAIPGAREHAIAVKPIAGFLKRLDATQARLATLGRPARLAVVGGGAAGVELALSLQERFRAEMILFAGGGLVPALNGGMRKRVRLALDAAGIIVREGERVTCIEEGVILSTDGKRTPCDAAFVSTHAMLPQWLAKSDLPKADNGGLAVRQTLQTWEDDTVFAVGDCATMQEHPRPRAGVFAVRQGPILVQNLLAAATGKPLEAYIPQKDFLTILRTGPRHAIAGRGPYLAFEGAWVRRWKDRIDRQFMERFAVEDRAPEQEDQSMRCGGCAAKVGPQPLRQALARLPASPANSDVVVGLAAPDDAAVVAVGGGAPLIVSVDQFRSMMDDPYVFGRIAANHALNDVYAMGGTPHHALALAVLPFGNPAKVAEDLFQLLSGARATLDAAGAALVGGHSAEGENLALGFSVAGLPASGATGLRFLTKQGAIPNDVLLLTKPLGTGIAFAADMRAMAPASVVEAAIQTMLVSNASAAKILLDFGARAVTDVSGFGLAGHLAEMLEKNVGAELHWQDIPMLEGILALAGKGFASSLLPQNNVDQHSHFPFSPLKAEQSAVLYDPQTAGGLLAAIPAEHASGCIAALVAAGYREAAVTGRFTDRAGIRLFS